MSVHLAVSLVITVLVVAAFIVALVSNTLVLALMLRRHRLRLVANRFVANLAAISLLSATTMCPLLLADLWLSDASGDTPTVGLISATTRSTLTQLCHGLDAISMFCVSSSILATLLIAGDRYCAVNAALRYHAIATRARSLVAIVANWTVGLVLAVLTALFPETVKSWSSCSTATESQSVYHLPLNVIGVLTLFLVPLAAMIWMYVRIYMYAHRSSAKQRRVTGSSRTSLTVPAFDCKLLSDGAHVSDYGTQTGKSADLGSSNLYRSTSVLIVNSIKHKLSNASSFMGREEGRTARISSLVIGLFFLSWTPYFVMKILSTHIQLHIVFIHTAALLAASNAAISPFTYKFRSKRGRREVWQLLGLAPVQRRRQQRRYMVPMVHVLTSPHYNTTVTSLCQLGLWQMERHSRLTRSEPALNVCQLSQQQQQQQHKHEPQQQEQQEEVQTPVVLRKQHRPVTKSASTPATADEVLHPSYTGSCWSDDSHSSGSSAKSDV